VPRSAGGLSYTYRRGGRTCIPIDEARIEVRRAVVAVIDTKDALTNDTRHVFEIYRVSIEVHDMDV
jgi:hypothetical protein